MVKDTDPVRGTRISLDLLSVLILDRDSWDSCSFPWTIFNWLSDDVNISTSCVYIKAVNEYWHFFSNGVLAMPDTETETETEIDTDKLAQNSMGICVKCLSLCCVNISAQFCTTHFWIGLDVGRFEHTIWVERETDRACPTWYNSNRYGVFTLVETRTDNYN